MAGGRPVEYSEEHIKKAREYLASCEDQESERQTGDRTTFKVKVKLPSKGGMAVHLGVARETLYDWASKYPEFSDIMEELSAKQEQRLIDNGLSGDYNPTIAKVLLTKHGYSDKQEIDHTTKGEAINNSAEIAALTAKLNETLRQGN